MGRFYKATAGKFIEDKMFQLDTDMMMKATQKVDSDMRSVGETGDTAMEGLDIAGLNEDDPIIRARIKEHEDAITGVNQLMYEDSIGYKKHGVTMRGISRGISKDISTGVLGTAKKNLTYSKEMEATMAKRKDVSGERQALYNKATLHDYKKAGGAGELKDIREFKQDVGDDIGDTTQFIKDGLSQIEYLTKKKGNGTDVQGGYWKTSVGGKDAIGYTTTNQTEVTTERIMTSFNGMLDAKNFDEYKTKDYETQIRLGEIEAPEDPEEQVDYIKQLVSDDRAEIINAAIGMKAGTKGHKQANVKGMPGGYGGSGGPGAKDKIVGLEIDDASNTVVPKASIAKTKVIDSLSRLFELIPYYLQLLP
jgi:hypothetical protein